jgi:hypothetical protein
MLGTNEGTNEAGLVEPVTAAAAGKAGRPATARPPGQRGEGRVRGGRMVIGPPKTLPLHSSTADWPPQAEMVLSAIEAGQFPNDNRRTAPRRRYRVKACLHLFSDAPETAPWMLFTRDIHARGLGFITPHRLPLGHGGLIELPVGESSRIHIPCTLLRCREAAPGWFEGSLYFNRDQPQFG